MTKYRNVIIAVLSLCLSHLPNVAFAEVAINQANQMVPTSVVVEDYNRQQVEAKVLNFLNKDDVQKKLVSQGLSADEAKSRIASLSNQELQSLSKQIDQAQYGGDILVAILLVVLIIFLIKRL